MQVVLLNRTNEMVSLIHKMLELVEIDVGLARFMLGVESLQTNLSRVFKNKWRKVLELD